MIIIIIIIIIIIKHLKVAFYDISDRSNLED